MMHCWTKRFPAHSKVMPFTWIWPAFFPFFFFFLFFGQLCVGSFSLYEEPVMSHLNKAFNFKYDGILIAMYLGSS